MNVTEKELKQLSEMLSRYESEHGAVAEYAHDATNCYTCSGGCNNFCTNTCIGKCDGNGSASSVCWSSSR